jgi:hypothetical protein
MTTDNNGFIPFLLMWAWSHQARKQGQGSR